MELGVRWPDQASLTLAGVGSGWRGLKVADLHRINGENINLGIGGVTSTPTRRTATATSWPTRASACKNREKASILIGDRVPVITTTSTANVGVAESVNYLDVGLKLEVEPNVFLDNEVGVKINLEVSATS